MRTRSEFPQCASLLIGMMFAGAGSACGAVTSNIPSLFQPGFYYQSVGGPTVFSFDTSPPASIFWDRIAPSTPSPVPVPGTPVQHTDTGGSMLVRVGLNGLPPGQPIWRAMDLMTVSIIPGPSTAIVSTFQTELLAAKDMWRRGENPPCIRESPSRASLGQATVTAGLDGLYQIDSFFDVFFEISLDEGQTWAESSVPLRFELVPAPSSVGLLAMAGLVAARRRRAV